MADDDDDDFDAVLKQAEAEVQEGPAASAAADAAAAAAAAAEEDYSPSAALEGLEGSAALGTAASSSGGGGEWDDVPADSSKSRKPKSGRDLSKGGNFKQKVAEEVKSALKSFFQAGRITSKEDFKHLARELTHKIITKDGGRRLWDSKMPGKIRKHVDGVFAKDFVYIR